MEIIFATGNAHKVAEINAISLGSGINFVLPQGKFNPVEDGLTFEDNSYVKAKFAYTFGKKVLADDSGLCVEALDGAPGIYSARYAETPQLRIEKLLNTLGEEKNRRAKFVCAMTLLDENGNVEFKTVGECHGKIAYEAKGHNGFGYDPIFIPDGYDVTIAELSEKTKNEISHRSKALSSVLKYLK